MEAFDCSISPRAHRVANHPLALRGRVAQVRGASLALVAAFLPAGAEAGFTTINDPADKPFNGATFTNLLGINNSGLIAGFYGSGQAGDPNTGFLLTLPDTFTPDNFPPPFVQSQMTGLNDIGVHTGYTYPTNNGVPVDFQFGFYETGGKFTMVNNPKTPDCSVPGACDPGVITENQLLGLTNKDLAVGFYNDRHGVSHGYTYNIATNTFSANIDDPNASLTNGGTVAAAINNSDEIAGFYTDSMGNINGFLYNAGAFTTVDAPGAAETQLLGLNDNGLAVGFYCTAVNASGCVGGTMHGLIFNSLTDTFTTVDAPLGIG
ncbi:MAG TPA: hypothetical protein VEH77_05655, partial [Roseiarcus sp.]|nr:hypothetical protein [Roseiarcus sp.]